MSMNFVLLSLSAVTVLAR